jgi:hypothetical protein
MPFLIALDQVERSGVTRRYAARLRENQGEQRQEVTLGGQSDADARELSELPMAVSLLSPHQSIGDQGRRVTEGAAQLHGDETRCGVAGDEPGK